MIADFLMLSAMAATAAMGAAVPNPQVEPHCDNYYRIEKWGVTVTQPRWNSTSFGTFKGCTDFIAKRDGGPDNPDTKVETTDDQWYTSYVTGNETPEDMLFDRAIAELCGQTYCDGTKEISTSSGRSDTAEGTEIYISLDGEFPDSGLRDNFFSLLTDAVRKSIQEVEAIPGELYTHNGVAFGNGVTTYGDASGYSLTLRMRNGNPGSGVNCPDAVNTINSFGALVPELAPVFGFAAAICSI